VRFLALGPSAVFAVPAGGDLLVGVRGFFPAFEAVVDADELARGFAQDGDERLAVLEFFARGGAG
jgi:hypothetical protein